MVEWKAIEELGTFFGGLTGKSKKDFDNGNAKFITYMNVFSNPSLSGSVVGEVKINEGEKQNKIHKGDILFTGSSETPQEAGMSCVVTEEPPEDYYMNSFCFGLRLYNDDCNLDYFKHLLHSNNVRKDISKSASGVTRFNISKSRFGKISLPIPSLEEQNRIVRILDTFTDAIENLKQQIDQRRKQYACIIDECYGGSFKVLMQKSESGEIMVEPLSKHGNFIRGKRFVRTDIVDEGQPCIHYGDMYTYYGLCTDKAKTHLPADFPKKMRYAEKGDVVIVGAGENNEDIGVGLVWQGEHPAAVHILSERGGQLRLRTSFEEGPVHVVINGEEKRVPVQNGLVVLNTAEGDEIVIYAGNDRPEITVHPLPGNENEYHYYGVKKIARF